MQLTTLALLIALHCGMTPEASIAYWSYHYDVPYVYAMSIATKESGLENIYGDNGDAYGMWQWHKESIDIVINQMILSGDLPPETVLSGDIRGNYWLSTQCALYAMGEMDLYRWWSTDKLYKHLR